MRKLKRLPFIRSTDEFLIRDNHDLVFMTSVAFTFRLGLIFRLSTNEDGKSTSTSCCKQPMLDSILLNPNFDGGGQKEQKLKPLKD